MTKNKQKNKKRSKLQAVRCDMERFESDVVHRLDDAKNREARRYKSGRNCPTASWADAVWFGDKHERIDGTTDRSRVEFPPGMDETLMIRCCECGRYTPPQNTVELAICDDCASDRGNCVCTRSDALSEELARRSAVYQELRQIGLTDREIAVTSQWRSGKSVRQLARFFGRSTRAIQQSISSAKAKIAKHGLQVPQRQQAPKAGRPRIIDPQKLESMAAPAN